MGSGVSCIWALLPAPFARCDLEQVSNLSGSHLIPPIYCREIPVEAESSLCILSCSHLPPPHHCISQAGGVSSPTAFGGEAVIFLGGGFLAGCAPEFLSSFAARVSHPSDSTLLVPPPGSPSRTQLSAREPLRCSRTHSPSKRRSFRPPDQPRQPGHAKLVCRSSHRASLRACV